MNADAEQELLEHAAMDHEAGMPSLIHVFWVIYRGNVYLFVHLHVLPSVDIDLHNSADFHSLYDNYHVLHG